MFGYLPGQSGYNRRLRAAAGLIATLIRVLAADTSLWTDDVWVVDSTPVECGRSQDTARRSDLAGWAEYGYCASHSRWFWGLRLHLVATLGGLPIAFALTGAKADERQTLLGILNAGPALAATRTRADPHRRPAVLQQRRAQSWSVDKPQRMRPNEAICAAPSTPSAQKSGVQIRRSA